MSEYHRPKVGTAVIIRKDGKVLMHKRKSKMGFGTWAFPGGHLEFHETVIDCFIRETKEESDVEITNIKIGPYTNDINIKENMHYITLFGVADWKSGEAKVMEPDKCEKWEWFNWNNLPQPLMLTVEILKKTDFDPFDI